MIGVLLVTHGQFCESMKESTEMVLGVQKNFYSLPLNPEDDIVCLQSRLLNKIQEMDQGEGVIVLVDLFGGSPYNAAFETVIGQDRMDVITGLSLPMLIDVVGIRTMEEDIKAGEVYDKLSGDYVKSCKKLLGNTNEDEMEDDEL